MNHKPDPRILTVHNAGTAEFRRYVISDQFLRYFAGSSWENDPRKAVLYHEASRATEMIHQILMTDYCGKRVRRFEAPIYVDLFADSEVSLEELRQWLCDVSKLIMDSPAHGNGPVQGALGLTWIDWDKLEELPTSGR